MQNSASPPPLRHPVPTHPAYIPEPPSTPGYQRYTSSPQYSQQPQPGSVPAYAAYQPAAYGVPPQQQHQHQHQPPPPQGAFNVPPADFAAWGMNDATAQLGLQLGHSAVAAGQDYVQKNFSFGSFNIKPHFNVSNSYVLQKIQLILFPWRHKPWARRQSNPPPREDINSPDLYIPLMAVVTYILLAAIHSGLSNQFHPQVLGESASKAVMTLLVDFFFVYVACYFLNVPVIATDLVAYTAYKFVGVTTLILPGLLYPGGVGSIVWYGMFLYVVGANAFFMLRSLRSVILPSDPSTSNTSPPQRRRRIIFLFIEAVFCQAMYMGILVRV